MRLIQEKYTISKVSSDFHDTKRNKGNLLRSMGDPLQIIHVIKCKRLFHDMLWDNKFIINHKHVSISFLFINATLWPWTKKDVLEQV